MHGAEVAIVKWGTVALGAAALAVIAGTLALTVRGGGGGSGQRAAAPTAPLVDPVMQIVTGNTTQSPSASVTPTPPCRRAAADESDPTGSDSSNAAPASRACPAKRKASSGANRADDQAGDRGGDNQAGDNQAGDNQAGDNQAGDNQAGDRGGDNQAGDNKNSGD
jgi:hypothetical protein